MSSDYKVLVTSSEFPEAGLELLRDKVNILQTKSNGFDVDTVEDCKKEIWKLIDDVDAIIWCTKIPFGKELLDKAGKKLKVVASFSAGVDHFDINEFKSHRVPLTNTPNVLDNAVAELAILLLIGVSRKINDGIDQIKSGKWEIGPQKNLGVEIMGSTIGLVGFGNIGQAVAKKLKGFSVGEFLYSGHNEKPEGKELGAKFVPFDELLQKSDYVILTCSLNESTKNLMNSKAFNKMKKNAILINISRGGVVDNDALVSALKNNTIFGAGLDVMTPEPLPNDHPLTSLPNCFLLPHIGSATVNTRNEMAKLCALNVLLGLTDEALLTPVFKLDGDMQQCTNPPKCQNKK